MQQGEMGSDGDHASSKQAFSAQPHLKLGRAAILLHRSKTNPARLVMSLCDGSPLGTNAHGSMLNTASLLLTSSVSFQHGYYEQDQNLAPPGSCLHTTFAPICLFGSTCLSFIGHHVYSCHGQCGYRWEKKKSCTSECLSSLSIGLHFLLLQITDERHAARLLPPARMLTTCVRCSPRCGTEAQA